jgi:hypothetical protein
MPREFGIDNLHEQVVGRCDSNHKPGLGMQFLHQLAQPPVCPVAFDDPGAEFGKARRGQIGLGSRVEHQMRGIDHGLEQLVGGRRVHFEVTRNLDCP